MTAHLDGDAEFSNLTFWLTGSQMVFICMQVIEA